MERRNVVAFCKKRLLKLIMIDSYKYNSELDKIYTTIPDKHITKTQFMEKSAETIAEGLYEFITDNDKEAFTRCAEKMEKELLKKWFRRKEEITLPITQMLSDIGKVTYKNVKKPFGGVLMGKKFKYAYTYIANLKKFLTPEMEQQMEQHTDQIQRIKEEINRDIKFQQVSEKYLRNMMELIKSSPAVTITKKSFIKALNEATNFCVEECTDEKEVAVYKRNREVLQKKLLRAFFSRKRKVTLRVITWEAKIKSIICEEYIIPETGCIQINEDMKLRAEYVAADKLTSVLESLLLPKTWENKEEYEALLEEMNKELQELVETGQLPPLKSTDVDFEVGAFKSPVD